MGAIAAGAGALGATIGFTTAGGAGGGTNIGVAGLAGAADSAGSLAGLAVGATGLGALAVDLVMAGAGLAGVAAGFPKPKIRLKNPALGAPVFNGAGAGEVF